LAKAVLSRRVRCCRRRCTEPWWRRLRCRARPVTGAEEQEQEREQEQEERGWGEVGEGGIIIRILGEEICMGLQRISLILGEESCMGLQRISCAEVASPLCG